MIIENQEICDISFNIISTNWKIKDCTITGSIENNTGDGKIIFINCEFPNGLNIKNNKCKIIVREKSILENTNESNILKLKEFRDYVLDNNNSHISSNTDDLVSILTIKSLKKLKKVMKKKTKNKQI